VFFNNYSKPGPGVKKRDPNLPRKQIFFEILPRNIWKLTKLNILYLSFALPFFIVTMLAMGVISTPIVNMLATQQDIGMTDVAGHDIIIRFGLSFWFTVFLGQGPITAGLTYIVREYGNENHCWLFSDFIERIKSNFKQGIALWIVDLLVVCGGSIALMFYLRAKMLFLVIALVAVLNIFFLAHIYIYQMMITYDLNLKHIFKNSVLIALGKLPQSLIIIAGFIIVYILIPYIALFYGQGLVFLAVLAIEVFLFPALTTFTVNFYIKPILEKYIGEV